MDPNLYFLCLMVLLPLVVLWPTHLLLRKVFAPPPADGRD
jgi:hypothetical protein